MTLSAFAAEPARLQQALAGCQHEAPATVLRQLVAQGLDTLPQPGGGTTLARWQALALVGAHDLSLAKLYEGHTDALAILQELQAIDGLGRVVRTNGLWAVWAAEAPAARVQLQRDAAGQIRLTGTKAWCSGAADVDHALLTAWWPDPAEGPQLVAVALQQPGVTVDIRPWQAVGMVASASASVHFEKVPAALVGRPGDYLQRPGFWHGGAGVAACWHGAAVALARALHQAAHPDAALRLAALGQVDVALSCTAALLREAAAWIDAHPQQDAQTVALRARQAVEHAARLVLDEVTRALGAAPLCLDGGFARRAADLPVFIRQSHGARDDAALGELLRAGAEPRWMP